MRGFRCRSSLKKSDPPEKPLDQSAISLFFLAASPIVASAFVRRQVGLRPTKLLVAREKKPLVPRDVKSLLNVLFF